MSDDILVGPINPDHADFSNLVRIEYHGHLVLTTEQLASFYKCNKMNIIQNFNNNEEHFKEGEHYFKLIGDDLKAFKNSVEALDIVGRNANTLYLWTRRGAARHCKMLGTDMAWKVHEMLEQAYFKVQEDGSRFKNPAVNEDLLKGQELTKLAMTTKNAPMRERLVRQAATLLTGDDYSDIEEYMPKNFVEKFIDRFCARDKTSYIRRGEFLSKLRIEYPEETANIGVQALTTEVKNIHGTEYRKVKDGGYAFRGIRWKK